MAIKRAISTTVLVFCLIGFTFWVAPKNNFGNEIVKCVIFWFGLLLLLGEGIEEHVLANGSPKS